MIRKAVIDDLDILVPLFDAYRQFYLQNSDPEKIRHFLYDRLSANESVIFIAWKENTPTGFTQLYPSFSSVRMSRLWILNDLFVYPEYRKRNIGRQLIEAAQEFTRNDGAQGMMLQTAVDNDAAQQLYARTGWTRDDEFYVYNWNA